MDDFDLHIVARKSIQGIFALVSRTFAIQILGIIANIILGAYLSLESFGVFFVVSSIVVFLNYFQDIGLAASLIQKKEEPTLEELRTTFTVQQVLVLLLIIPMILLSGVLAEFYNLKTNGYMLFLALLVSFFLSSLRTIPTVLLERRLEFKKLIIPQIIENVFYFSALIIFAVMGYGVTTFTIAVLLRSVTGLIATYMVQPWKIGFAFKKTSFKKLIGFGLPFQANSLLALIKDDLLTLYIGKVLPLAQVGFIGFSQKWAYMPLRLVMDNVIKITFPSFSRLQHDKDALKLAIEKSLYLVSFFIFPGAVVIILFSPFFIEFVPRYQKWEPALLSLTFFSLNTVMSSIATPLINFLNAIGKIKITLYFMIFWTIGTWVLTLILLKYIGYNGVALTTFLISLTSFLVIIVARRYVQFSFFKPVAKQFIAALLMAGFVFLTQGFISGLFSLFILLFVSGCFYLIVLFAISKDEMVKTGRFIISAIRATR